MANIIDEKLKKIKPASYLEMIELFKAKIEELMENFYNLIKESDKLKDYVKIEENIIALRKGMSKGNPLKIKTYRFKYEDMVLEFGTSSMDIFQNKFRISIRTIFGQFFWMLDPYLYLLENKNRSKRELYDWYIKLRGYENPQELNNEIIAEIILNGLGLKEYSESNIDKMLTASD